jgi:hypothetical protein
VEVMLLIGLYSGKLEVVRASQWLFKQRESEMLH